MAQRATTAKARTPTKRAAARKASPKASSKTARRASRTRAVKPETPPVEIPRLKNKAYLPELSRLQIELVKLQEWIRHEGLRVVVVFEGRDAAGKGGVIKT